MVTLLYRTPQLTIEYNTVIWRTWVMAADSNVAFKIATKPLQIETRLLLTAYRNSLSSYPTLPVPTPYDLSLSHHTARVAYHSALRPYKVIDLHVI